MNRVTIIGNGGAGKSTLSIILGEKLLLPVYHLDQVIWKENWEAVSEPEFNSRHQKLLNNKRWIIEGMGYDSSIERRFESSEAIIYIDFHILAHFFWAIKRSLKSIIIPPSGWQAGCQTITKLPYTLRIIWDIHKKTRPYILSLIVKYSKVKKVIHIKNPKQLNIFYNTCEDL